MDEQDRQDLALGTRSAWHAPLTMAYEFVARP